MEIVLATRNIKKAGELRRIMNENVTILTLDDLPSCPEVEEDAGTFEGNAIKKAVTIAKCTQKAVAADDSGLEVYALNNAPGVMSARYAGKNAEDIDNTNKLLCEMQHLTDEQRGARFVCCIALALPSGLSAGLSDGIDEIKVETFFGYAEGFIAKELHGSMGFGYDPVFYPAGHARTFAEMTDEEKDALSHRRAALEGLKGYLRSHF